MIYAVFCGPFTWNDMTTSTVRATGLILFAYTGYSRIATLVEEVRNPRRTIPRATVLALGSATAIAVLGATKLSQSYSPLAATLLSQVS